MQSLRHGLRVVVVRAYTPVTATRVHEAPSAEDPQERRDAVKECACCSMRSTA